MIINLGTLFLTLVIIATIPFFLCCTYPCKKRSEWFSKKHVSVSKSMQGNTFIRFLLEGCLDISICAYLQLFTSHEGEERLMWGTAFDIINNLSCIILATAVAIFPVFILVFYCYKFEKWESEEFSEKYGAVFEGLRKDSRASLLYPIFFILRRFILVIVATVTQKNIFVQVLSMQVLSFLQISYLVRYRPFEEPLLQKLEIFNEVTTILLVDLLTIFSDGNYMKKEFAMDILFLVCLFSNIAVHMYFLIKDSLHSVRLRCKRRGGCCNSCCCRRNKKKKGRR